jgi:hypothetical protein
MGTVKSWQGKEQHVKCSLRSPTTSSYGSESRVKARLHHGEGGTYLWVANPTRQTLPVHLELGEAWGLFSSGHSLWGAEATVTGRTITLTAGARDVAVIALF